MDEILLDIYSQLKTATLLDYALLVAITLLGIYIYYKIRFRYEIEKSQLENKKTELEIFKEYLISYELLNDSKKDFIYLLTKLGESKTEKEKIVITQDLSNRYYLILFPAFRNVLEYAKIKNRHQRKENLLFIQEEIIPFLEASKMYFSLVGDTGLDRSTLEPIYHFGKENLCLFDLQLKKKLISCIRGIEMDNDNQIYLPLQSYL